MSPLIAAALIVLLEGLSFAAMLPVLHDYVEDALGAGASAGAEAIWWTSALFAAGTLPRVVVAPLWGRISDAIGRRPTVAIVALGTSAAWAVWALAPMLGGSLTTAIGWLLVSRLIYGCFAAQSVLCMAVASDVSTPEKRAAAMGHVGAAFGVAFTIGPLIGAGVAIAFGNAAIGWLNVLYGAGTIFIALRLLKETRPTEASGGGGDDAYIPPTKMLAMITRPHIASIILITLVSTAAYSILFPTLDELTSMRYGWSRGTLGLAFALFGLVGIYVQGWKIRPMVKKRGEKFTAAFGLLLLVLGLLWTAPGSNPDNALHVINFWLSLSLIAVGTGFCVPAITAMISLGVHERDQGAAHGLNQSATALGRTIGFFFPALVFAAQGPTVTYLCAAAAAGLALLITLACKNRKPEAGNPNECPKPQ